MIMHAFDMQLFIRAVYLLTEWESLFVHRTNKFLGVYGFSFSSPRTQSRILKSLILTFDCWEYRASLEGPHKLTSGTLPCHSLSSFRFSSFSRPRALFDWEVSY